MATQLPDDYYCFWCKAAYHQCTETDDRGFCAQKPRCILEGDWAYMRIKGRWVAEHMPTATTTISYDSETAVRNAVAAGRALWIVTGSHTNRDAA